MTKGGGGVIVKLKLSTQGNYRKKEMKKSQYGSDNKP